jgi:hypothetical protein
MEMTKMADDKNAYNHSDDITGFGADRGSSPSTEHRETTSTSADDRNELDPEQRQRPDAYGPRTHKDTNITTKDGSKS